MEKKRYGKIRRAVQLRFGAAAVVCALLLWPLGWQGQIYWLVIFAPMAAAGVYFLKNKPELLERRMRYREKEPEQKKLVPAALMIFLLGIAAIILDRHYSWSTVPAWAALAADAISLAGYLLVFWVFKENPWASRIIEVESDQQLVTTGPYAFIRHPMYLGSMVMMLALPIAFGVWYPVLLSVIYAELLVRRIDGEEVFLKRNLPGYEIYCRQVRYRLLPGIW